MTRDHSSPSGSSRVAERQFLVMLDGAADIDAVSSIVQSNVPGAKRRSHRSLLVPDGLVQIWLNDDWDARRSNERDGFLFWRFRLEVSPGKELTDEELIGFAGELLLLFRSCGLKATVCAEFEREVDLWLEEKLEK